MSVRPRPFCESGVVAVRVRQQHGFQVVERAAEGADRPRERLPIAGRSRIDERELAGVLDQIEVDDALREPMDAVGDLHARIVALGCLPLTPAERRW